MQQQPSKKLLQVPAAGACRSVSTAVSPLSKAIVCSFAPKVFLPKLT